MRLFLLTTLLLLLLNVTKQEKVFSKILQGTKEIQRVHERLPVKNYVSVQDNENRKVNKYKDDLSQENEEIFEEKPQKQFLKKKQKEVNNFKYHEIKKELKKTYDDNLNMARYKAKINVEEDDKDINDLRTIKNKKYLDKEGSKKYSKQRNEKSLNEKDKDNGFAVRMKQKTTHEFYEEKGKKGSVNKLRFKKGLGEDNESSQDDVDKQEGKSYKTEETDEEDDSLDSDDSLQCDSADDGNCEV